MIIDYSRPKSIKEALELLARKEPRSIPLAGGSVVSKYKGDPVAVIDLQDLGLDKITKEDGATNVGSMVTLDSFDRYFRNSDIAEAISIQATKNKRSSNTLGGLVCMADGRSTLLTLLLAMDAELIWEPEGKTISLGNWLPLRQGWSDGKIITTIRIPETEIKFGSISRSPKDLPIFCCALAKWNSGRIRVAVGGFGSLPTLVLDGNTSDDVQTAVKVALQEANDQWASADYRMEAGSKLANRLFTNLVPSKN